MKYIKAPTINMFIITGPNVFQTVSLSIIESDTKPIFRQIQTGEHLNNIANFQTTWVLGLSIFCCIFLNSENNKSINQMVGNRYEQKGNVKNIYHPVQPFPFHL